MAVNLQYEDFPVEIQHIILLEAKSSSCRLVVGYGERSL